MCGSVCHNRRSKTKHKKDIESYERIWLI